MKRLLVIAMLSLALSAFSLPLCSNCLLKGLYESTYTNKIIRLDIFNRGSKENSLTICSNNIFRKAWWDKSDNGTVIEDTLKGRWQKYQVRAQAVKSGEVHIILRGPSKMHGNARYPVLVDYKDLRVNGVTVFDEKRSMWHDTPFSYKLKVRDGEMVNISFEACRHHFQVNDVTKVYKTNLWILLVIVVLSFFISWKFVNHIAKLRKTEHIRCVDIILVSSFFGLLFVPMSNINTAEKSDVENRRLTEAPKLFKDTGGGYNLRFGKDAEEWFNDRFYGRDIALYLDRELKYNVNRIYRKRNALYISENNWMFLKEHQINLNEENLSEIAYELSKFNQFCIQNHIKLYVLLVPLKNAIYHEVLEGSYVYRIEDNQDFAQYENQINTLRQRTGIPIIYPFEELRNASQKDFVFFKQAHHWTEWGAYQGYRALMSEINQDFPDIQVISLSDYEKFTSKKIRDDWGREFNTGHTTRLLGFSSKFAEKYLLRDKYVYYNHKSGDNLKIRKTSEKFSIKNFEWKDGKYRILLTGNSQNENLLQYLPYSAGELKYIRLNRAKIPIREQPKLLKYYSKEIVDFNPDILIYCISSERTKDFLPNITKK